MGDKVGLNRIKSEETIQDGIYKTLKLINFDGKKEVNQVAIKPNLCYYWNADTGYTTDPNLISAIIDWIREIYGETVKIIIVESDATGMRTSLAFQILGYNKLAKNKRVDLINLSEDQIMIKEVIINGKKIKFKVPKLLLDTDLFINVPKLKLLQETKITCAMKNVFGCIAHKEKIIYHHFLNEAIVGINKILKPQLNIVDGIVALGRYPIRLNLIMSSVDPFSIDWVASQIMGYHPSNVKFLQIAVNEKVGEVKGINVIGENLRELQRQFPNEGLMHSKQSWAIQFKLLHLYCRVVGDIVPPLLMDN